MTEKLTAGKSQLDEDTKELIAVMKIAIPKAESYMSRLRKLKNDLYETVTEVTDGIYQGKVSDLDMQILALKKYIDYYNLSPIKQKKFDTYVNDFRNKAYEETEDGTTVPENTASTLKH